MKLIHILLTLQIITMDPLIAMGPQIEQPKIEVKYQPKTLFEQSIKAVSDPILKILSDKMDPSDEIINRLKNLPWQLQIAVIDILITDIYKADTYFAMNVIWTLEKLILLAPKEFQDEIVSRLIKLLELRYTTIPFLVSYTEFRYPSDNFEAILKILLKNSTEQDHFNALEYALKKEIDSPVIQKFDRTGQLVHFVTLETLLRAGINPAARDLTRGSIINLIEQWETEAEKHPEQPTSINTDAIILIKEILQNAIAEHYKKMPVTSEIFAED